MKVLPYVLVILASYLIGCSNMAYYLSLLTKKDLRSEGSGNLGTSNAMILLGWRAAFVVGIHDIGKAVLAVELARHFFGGVRLIAPIAGVSCVVGHIFPFYLKFRGGKGFASFVGMTFAMNWKLALATMLLVAMLTLVTDYIVVGTVTAVLTVPACIGYLTQDMPMVLVLCVASMLILYKHQENFERLRSGEEAGLREVNRAKRA